MTWSNGRPRVCLVDYKARRSDRTYHRIQVALYRMLMRRMLDGRSVPVGGTIVPTDAIACMIARIDEDKNTNQSILGLPALDLESEVANVGRRLGSAGGSTA